MGQGLDLLGPESFPACGPFSLSHQHHRRVARSWVLFRVRQIEFPEHHAVEQHPDAMILAEARAFQLFLFLFFATISMFLSGFALQALATF